MSFLEFFSHIVSPTLFFSCYLFFISLRKNLVSNVQDPVLFDLTCGIISVLASSSAYYFIVSVADLSLFISDFGETSSVSDSFGCESKTLDVSGGQSKSKVPETASLETKLPRVLRTNE